MPLATQLSLSLMMTCC